MVFLWEELVWNTQASVLDLNKLDVNIDQPEFHLLTDWSAKGASARDSIEGSIQSGDYDSDQTGTQHVISYYMSRTKYKMMTTMMTMDNGQNTKS